MSNTLSKRAALAGTVVPSLEIAGEILNDEAMFEYIDGLYQRNRVDRLTIAHAARVGLGCAAVAGSVDLSHRDAARAGATHDNGKHIGMRHLLDKPGRLTPEETKIVQTHALYGMESVLTNPVIGDPEATLIMAVAAGMHHRGKNYPPYEQIVHLLQTHTLLSPGEIQDTLRDDGDMAALVSLVAMLDALDALLFRRPYSIERLAREGVRGAVGVSRALEIVEAEMGDLLRIPRINSIHRAVVEYALDSRHVLEEMSAEYRLQFAA